MIVYFSDRQMQVMGLASTNLPDGFVIIEDLKTEEIETGATTFSCRIGFDDETRLELESMTNAGNFLLRSHNGENEFYTIIDTEIDTKNKTINIYAEDAGLDLINEIADEFEATESKTIDWYVNKYIAGSGFEIGINEEKSALRKLKWEGEETVTARLASIATQFGGCEISYSFEIDGLTITKKYVNIHKERGKDDGTTLRLNKDIDKIITTKSVANLATAFLCEGGVPDKAEEPITFSNTKYTWYDSDNDFYIDGDLLKSRKAIQKWSRQAVKLNRGDGIIVRPYSYNTTDPATLRAHAVTELKKVCDMEVNYEVDISVLPESVKIGDRINIVDDAGELYLSTRILVLETSVVDQKHSAILGEHLIKTSGISQKVADLAEQFAKTSVSAAQALSVANAANTVAEAAQAQAGAAAQESANALAVAGEAQTAAQNASTSASEAKAKADAAEEAVSGVEATISEMETVVSEAEQLAESAKASADIATAQAAEAKAAASNAETKANEASTAAGEAKTKAESAISTASTANTQAEEAKANAQAASDVAAAAKLDSEQAKKDVEAFGESLETFEATMKADYARKTELTETTASLDAKITANANQLSITHSKVLTVDETANNAKSLAEAAQSAADGAQATASQATAEAEAAQTAASQAKAAADAAQSEADKAKAAADAAQGVANKAESDLATAKANLEAVTGRVDATEADIAAAQTAVNTAQQAADKAKADAATAAQKATNAQTTADTAVTNAATAQSAANDAASKANAAQATANEAKGNAATAKAAADEAKATAATAQATANTAVTNAETAQAKADQAATDAATAKAAADAADAKAAAAQTDLNTAKTNLESVKSRVDATEEEIAAAEQAVALAQKAADDAAAAAVAAQSTADTAQANAATAKTAADNAKKAADDAQAAADAAQEAADKAQEDVDALSVRVTNAETNITQNSEAIKLTATKEEVTTSLGGYYKKTEMDAQLSVMADNISANVEKVEGLEERASNLEQTATSITSRVTAVENTEIGGRNLLFNSKGEFVSSTDASYGFWNLANDTYSHGIELKAGQSYTLSFDWAVDWGEVTPVSNVTASVGCGSTAGAFSYDIGAKALPNLSTETSGSVAFTFTPKAADLIGRPYFAMRPIRTNTADAVDGTTWTIKNIKLEKGDKATDWTPAPEDVSDDINKAQKTADGAVTNITVAQSQIQQLAESISSFVRGDGGGSLMKQDSDGIYYFDISELEKSLSDTANALDELNGIVLQANGDIDVLKSTAEALRQRTEYIRSYTDENDNPCLELGEGDSAYKAYITNNGIKLMDGTSTPTSVTRRMLVIEKAMVRDELQIGDEEDASTTGVWVWKRRSNGNLGLSWKGV